MQSEPDTEWELIHVGELGIAGTLTILFDMRHHSNLVRFGSTVPTLANQALPLVTTMLDSLIPIFTTGGAVFLTFLSIGWKADDAFSEEARNALSRLLLGVRTDRVYQTWPDVFARVFNHAFGNRHFSTTCISRSFLASILVLFLVSGILITIVAAEKKDGTFTENTYTLIAPMFRSLEFIIPLFLIYCVLFFFALLKARHLLYWLIGRPSRTTDILMGTALSAISYDLSLWTGQFLHLLVEYSILWPRVTLVLIFNTILDALLFLMVIAPTEHLADEQAVLLWFAAFSLIIPSTLIWLYAFSYLVLRTLARVTPLIEFTKFILPIARFPFRSICELAGVIACILYIGGAIMVLPFSGDSG